ncbi:sulfur carrier protein ThiS [Dysgonomonas sp. ZJ709]|uniref:sulfur carrier protein ThiS n=1 Tax=Dysgonomonas sp. ZJ709 TaxID=2709797 RepID=UPI0013EE34BB|nr:sulfur carrier protein ThiS [Dysgonomonas sp. ZJ709]
MIIKLNGQNHEIKERATIASFIEDLGLKSQGIAIAIDYEVIPKNEWAKTILSENDELMLIQAVSGG